MQGVDFFLDKPMELTSAQRLGLPFVAIADHYYVADNEDELSFEDGDEIMILREEEPGWVHGEFDSQKGLVPLTHIVMPKNPRISRVVDPHTKVDQTLDNVRAMVDRVLQHSGSQAREDQFSQAEARPPIYSSSSSQPRNLSAAQFSGNQNHLPPDFSAIGNSAQQVVPKLSFGGLPQAPPYQAPGQQAATIPEGGNDKDGGDEGLELTAERVAMMPFTAKAGYEYNANDLDELTFTVGEMIRIVRQTPDEGWVVGELNGRLGVVPLTHLENRIITDDAGKRDVEAPQETSRGLTFTPEQVRLLEQAAE